MMGRAGRWTMVAGWGGWKAGLSRSSVKTGYIPLNRGGKVASVAMANRGEAMYEACRGWTCMEFRIRTVSDRGS